MVEPPCGAVLGAGGCQSHGHITTALGRRGTVFVPIHKTLAVSGLSCILLVSVCCTVRQLLMQLPSLKLGSWCHSWGQAVPYPSSQLVAREGGEVAMQESCCQPTGEHASKGHTESVPRCDFSILQVPKEKQRRLWQLPWHLQL